MKASEFRKLIREEVRKVINNKQIKESHDNGDYANSGEDEGIYDMLGPVVGKQQKLFDTEYGWVMRELMELDDMQSYMNRYNSFETPEDIKKFNEGAIEYFTKFITKLKRINNKPQWFLLLSPLYIGEPAEREAAPVLKSGQTLDNYDLTDNYIKEDDVDSWLELLDERPFNGPRFVEMANEWLQENGYSFRVSKVTSNNNGETMTWTIK